MEMHRCQIPGYQALDLVHESANAEVYRAVRKQDLRPVILKTLKPAHATPAGLSRLRHEYEVIRSLNAANVIQAYGLESHGQAMALVLEDFGGEPLSHWIRAWQRVGSEELPLSRFLALALQMVEGLGQIHAAGVIHKDLTAANILANPGADVVKICDFGIATTLSRETAPLTNAQMLEGSLSYLSPEQTGRMNRTVDYRTDFYSLGVTFYELLTGRLPFEAADTMELVHAHLAKTPAAPHLLNPAVPEILSAIVLKLMAKAPEDRYQSASGLQHDLQVCLQRWKAGATIPAFALGREDRAEHFIIPEKLYGRAREVASLLAAFERTANGRAEMMLVAGFSGIGKTAVIHEVHKPITRQRGYFIQGKFDQFSRNVPFSAWVQAFRGLMEQLLGESPEQRQRWRSAVLAALGENGQVIVDVIPELERLIGPQAPAPRLSGTAAQNRFNLLFQKFIAIFTTADHPLVLFLDDLQWADLASLNLLQCRLGEDRLGHLLVLGAYRDNEVSSAHPLTMALAELEKSKATVHTLTLAPLQRADVNDLIADSLGCAPDRALPLTEFVYRITHGNPFFTTQLLKTLHNDGLITFDDAAGCWQCDLAKVRHWTPTEDVVEFMALELQRLPQATQEALKLAACIGNPFDLGALALVRRQSPDEAAADLWPAVQAGLVWSEGATYPSSRHDASEQGHGLSTLAPAPIPTCRFLHDRVQQAAYSLIPEAEKPATHLRIGQFLLRHASAAEDDERLFEIVNHLNVGRAFITDPEERQKLSQLNLAAGRKAKASVAYRAAVDYLRTGIELLPTDPWQRCYDFALALHDEITEAAYLETDYEQVERWATPVLQQARTILDTIKVHEVRILTAKSQGQNLAALRIGLEVLQALGTEFPAQPTSTDVAQAFETTRKLWQERHPLELLDLPAMTDPRCLASMRIMTLLIPAAYIAAPVYMPLLTCTQVGLSIQFGNCPISTFSYADYGLMLCGLMDDIEAGYAFGQLALRVLDRFEATPLQSRAGYIVYNFIRHWKDPLRELLPHLLQACQSGLETGDLENVGMDAHAYCNYSYFAGRDLASLADEIQAYHRTLRSLKQEIQVGYMEIVQQTVMNLLGASQTPWELTGLVCNSQEALARYHADNNRTSLFHYHFNQTVLYYLFGKHPEAARQSALVQEYLDGGLSQYPVALYSFYDSLIQLALCRGATADQAQILERVRAHQSKMRRWSILAPCNHQHHWELVEAELCRVLGQRLEAIEHYDSAIAHARANEFIQEAALAAELAAQFYLEWGKEKIAQTYLREARDGYRRWGSRAKVQQLEQRHARWLAPAADAAERPALRFPKGSTRDSEWGSATAGALDSVTVIKASQAMAGEIDLERLLRRMMRLVMENAGAQRGALILERNGRWVIEAQGDVDQEDVSVLQSLDPRTSDMVSADIVSHVAGTCASVVLDDAANAGDFTRDPHIAQQRVKSVICAPLVNQGRLSGIVYLENNLATHAFTSDRLELLNLLSAQMALSLDNARLYEEVQQELAERKHAELALREGEQRFRTIYDSVNDAIFVHDLATGAVLDINSTACLMLGHSREEILQLGIEDCSSGEPGYTKEEALARIKRTAEEGPQLFEWRAEHKDGRRFWIEVSMRRAAINGQDRILVVTRDINERKRAEEAFQKLSETQSVILNNSAVGIALVRNRVFEWVNPRMPEVFGLPPEQCQGAGTRIIYADEESYQKVGDQAGILAQGKKASVELVLRKGDGSPFWCRLEGMAVAPPNLAEGVIWTAEDITERKRAEMELARHRDRLEELVRERTAELENEVVERKQAEQKRLALELQLLNAQRLESVGQLAAGIAHEINTPTQFVGDNVKFLDDAFADLMKLIDSLDRLDAVAREKDLDRELLKDVEHARASADIGFLRTEIPKAIGQSLEGIQRVSKIVYAMKDFSHPDVAEKTATDLNRAIETTVTVARNEWKYVADVDLQLDPALPPVACFPGEINQVVLNLIVNAAHAIAEKLGPGAADKGTITISTQADGDMVEIRVADTGTGIPEQYRDRMFTLFFTTKDVGKGTGQGLAMAYNVIHKKHGGTIRFETEVGQGTTFIMRLPRGETVPATA